VTTESALIVLLISVDFADCIQTGIAEFYALILFALAGLLFASSANDFALLFVSLELITVTFYILTSFQRSQRRSLEAGVKYLIIGALSTCFTVFGIALVFADTVDWPYFEDVTSDFVYLRLHGSQELYVSGYDDAALDRWAARIALWAAGRAPQDAPCIASGMAAVGPRDVYVYFDNDAKVRAPFDALGLARRLSEAPR